MLEQHGPIVVQPHPTNSLDHGGKKHSTSLLPSSNSNSLFWVVFIKPIGNYRKVKCLFSFLYYNFSANDCTHPDQWVVVPETSSLILLFLFFATDCAEPLFLGYFCQNDILLEIPNGYIGRGEKIDPRLVPLNNFNNEHFINSYRTQNTTVQTTYIFNIIIIVPLSSPLLEHFNGQWLEQHCLFFFELVYYRISALVGSQK